MKRTVILVCGAALLVAVLIGIAMGNLAGGA
jgi:hypothetical protein